VDGTSSWLAPGIDAVGPFLEAAGISRDAATVTVYTPTVTEIFDEIDENGSGEIDFEEFADWWERNGGSQVSLAMAQDAFRLIEMRDGIPGLGFDELKEVMVALASDDWEEAFDQATGRKYFIDPHSKATTWLVPGVEIVGPFLTRVGITRNGVRASVRTRCAARGPSNGRRQTIDQQLPLNRVDKHRVGPDAAGSAVKERTRYLSAPTGGGDPALMHADMVDKVIATLDSASTGRILQSDFVTWWAAHQQRSLPVMEKLKFSRPISKAFATSSGTLTTWMFRELLVASFAKEIESGGAAERTADHMNTWLQCLLMFDSN
jgi:hypothetical protein